MDTDSDAQTTVLLVRHTEVENPARVLYGRLPRFPLSARGMRQAEVVAERLENTAVAAIYSSPLLRARQTAAAIASKHPAASRHRSVLLHEVRSAWQGSPFQAYATGFSTYDQPRAADDESIEQVLARMQRFVERVSDRHAGQTIVAVSHGDPITILRAALLGEPVTVATIRGPLYAEHGSVTEINLQPGHAPILTLHPGVD